jgi:hypothetical protein
MNKPPWDFSKDGRKLMHEWLDIMMGDIPYGMAALIDATNSPDAMRNFIGDVEPPKRLIERLAAGEASSDDQARAAELLNNLMFPKRSGPQPMPKHQRNPMLFMASNEARRINEMWREYYGHVDLKKATEFACERCRPVNEGESEDAYRVVLHELGSKVMRTLRRKQDRNFSKP